MAEALKQATIARQTRGFFTSFIQPPIGACLINADGVTGRSFNYTKSILHAETLTFIDFLKNYIQTHEKLPAGELTKEGEMKVIDAYFYDDDPVTGDPDNPYFHQNTDV